MTKTFSKQDKYFAILRISFGFVWLVDAILKWQPAFQNNFLGYLTGMTDGEPHWVVSWISFWIKIVAPHPHLFAISVALAETCIAIGLIFGLFTRATIFVGIIFSLLLWSVAEAFGGPYVSGATDIGCAIIYAFVFLGLYFGSCWNAYSIDAMLKNSKEEPAVEPEPEKVSAAQKIYSENKDRIMQILFSITIILLIAFLAPYFVSSEAQMPMTPDGMMQKTFELGGKNVLVPTISMTITPDALDGYDVHFITTNFTFTPQNINQAPVADEGHVHLVIDGKLSVVFGPWYHIDSAELPAGKHTVVGSLNANDHSIFTYNGANIQTTETLYTY